jgi:hypothetical protein
LGFDEVLAIGVSSFCPIEGDIPPTVTDIDCPTWYLKKNAIYYCDQRRKHVEKVRVNYLHTYLNS